MVLQSGSLLGATRYYGYLILLAPIVFAGFVWLASKRRSDSELFLAIAGLCGLVMLLSQFRFHPFGSWALIVGPLYFAHWLGEARALKPAYVAGGAMLVMLLSMQPGLRHQLFTKHVPGMDREYAVIQPIFDDFAAACDARPGIVLNAQDDGHPVRFHTNCRVLSNNFLLTEQHGETLIVANRLLQSKPDDLPSLVPFIDYVLVHINSLYTSTDDGPVPTPLDELKSLNPPLFYELAIDGNVPSSFELVAELRVEDERDIAYAQVYRINRSATPE